MRTTTHAQSALLVLHGSEIAGCHPVGSALSLTYTHDDCRQRARAERKRCACSSSAAGVWVSEWLSLHAVLFPSHSLATHPHSKKVKRRGTDLTPPIKSTVSSTVQSFGAASLAGRLARAPSPGDAIMSWKVRPTQSLTARAACRERERDTHTHTPHSVRSDCNERTQPRQRARSQNSRAFVRGSYERTSPQAPTHPQAAESTQVCVAGENFSTEAIESAGSSPHKCRQKLESDQPEKLTSSPFTLLTAPNRPSTCTAAPNHHHHPLRSAFQQRVQRHASIPQRTYVSVFDTHMSSGVMLISETLSRV
jgi:hypothetical protein